MISGYEKDCDFVSDNMKKWTSHAKEEVEKKGHKSQKAIEARPPLDMIEEDQDKHSLVSMAKQMIFYVNEEG